MYMYSMGCENDFNLLGQPDLRERGQGYMFIFKLGDHSNSHSQGRRNRSGWSGLGRINICEKRGGVASCVLTL